MDEPRPSDEAIKRLADSGLFDSDWYLAQNPDVRAAGVNPLVHYLQYGAAEGRDPNPLFDSDWYLAQNPDVRVAGVNPLVHYLRYGAAEGRDPNPRFDSDWYLAQNPDVRVAGVNPLVHYWRYGAAEGRDPNPLFDGDWYLAQNPDVRAAGDNPLVHYWRYGAGEGRDPNPLFDGDWYLAQNPDVRAAGDNPLVHYLRYGASEGRAPGPRFDGERYLQCNPDVRKAGVNPLGHYLRYGAAEGRNPDSLPIPDIQDLKEDFRIQCRVELATFLQGSERIVLPTSEQPDVSIVIVLFNQAELTFRCLRALVRVLDVPCEVILVDNASADQTAELCSRVDGARIVKNTENLHFLKAVNQVAPRTRGTAVLLLNNDTEINPGSIEAAFRLLQQDPGVGAVGGKIIRLDGSLQEAGSIVWNDGTCIGYGRGRKPTEPEFQFRRDVDYCSGVFLMVRRSVFERLDWFDPAYAPAYYEETDLCMRMRTAGFRIVYEPRVEVRHYEFGSARSEAEAIALQAANRGVFVDRHHAALEKYHHRPEAHPLDVRIHGHPRRRILVIDDMVPYPALGTGLPRSNAMLNSIHKSGWFITFYPLVDPHVDWNSAYRLLPAEIEIMADYGRASLEAFLRERSNYFDCVLVSRVHNISVFNEALKAVPHFLDNTPLIYDAEAIFANREALRLEVAGTPLPAAELAAMIDEEIALAKSASAVIAVNEKEASVLRERLDKDVRVLGHSVAARPTSTPFAKRTDILFVGPTDKDGSPNVDSVVWFVRTVMPLLDAALGADYGLKIVGRTGSRRATELAGPRVRFFGQVENLDEFYSTARILVAPTRYAAGIPHKVHDAAAAGLPVVATALLAAQLGWENGTDLLTGDLPEEFSNACRRLYSDEQLWQQVRDSALERVKDECSPLKFSEDLGSLLTSVADHRDFAENSSIATDHWQGQQWHVERSPGQRGERSPVAKRTAILVLGMHRSGTSAVGGAVSALGVALPKTPLPPKRENPRGFFESAHLFSAHNELLASAGSCWHDWRQLDAHWFRSRAAELCHQKIKAIIAAEFGDEPLILIKDPRICRFVPFMSSILAELNASPVAVIPIRNPLEVADSLQRRNGISLSNALLLWLRHVLEAEFHTRRMPRCIVSYEEFLVDWRSQIDRIAEKTGLAWPDATGLAAIKVDEFLTAALRHERHSRDDLGDYPEITRWVRDTYGICSDMAASGENGDLLSRLDVVRTEFDDACRLFGAALVEQESTASGLIAERDQLAAAHKSLIGERDALIASEKRLLRERDDLAVARHKLAVEHKALTEAYRRLAGEHDAVHKSRSWRLTAPLRRLRSLLWR